MTLVFFAFTAGPGPACHCVCVTPHGFGAGFPCVGVRFYADAGGMVQPPDQPIPLYLRGEAFRKCQSRPQPAEMMGRVLTGIFEAFVTDGTDARLSQIIPARPHKVADDIGEFFHQLPVMIQVLGQGLGPDNDAIRMERTVLLVSGRGVVVTANIPDKRNSPLWPSSAAGLAAIFSIIPPARFISMLKKALVGTLSIV